MKSIRHGDIIATQDRNSEQFASQAAELSHYAPIDLGRRPATRREQPSASAVKRTRHPDRLQLFLTLFGVKGESLPQGLTTRCYNP